MEEQIFSRSGYTERSLSVFEAVLHHAEADFKKKFELGFAEKEIGLILLGGSALIAEFLVKNYSDMRKSARFQHFQLLDGNTIEISPRRIFFYLETRQLATLSPELIGRTSLFTTDALQTEKPSQKSGDAIAESLRINFRRIFSGGKGQNGEILGELSEILFEEDIRSFLEGVFVASEVG